MTLKEKILFLTSTRGFTQQQVSEETGIEQSSVSRILNNTQKNIGYEKGVALDAFVNRERKNVQSKTS
ncbi:MULTISPECIES: MarR family transcriptional regulator [Acinetobacter calcoaceticus/baumannii complex]|uniref:MarR family transcriptional regulator n=1 Tax=Acinetobacter calcoaceticus/baumannii complex TaxID=909768 RepID=UPI00045185DB|nr:MULTISPECIES: helix-turn-helix domain-containing protein [Acinetobacter calcoaceticus/baumannii complex]EXB91192.1 helix-turn-helix family protein [Acinetobacter baumannii 466760]MBN6530152.1 helix-turn-helix domain-containing protein [Acinetobacter pittii]OBA12005.1 DNA-binding protein [Acinetobacter calcoaceticus]